MIARIIELSVFLVVASAISNDYCGTSCSNTHTVCARKVQKCGPGPLCGSEFQSIKLTDGDRQYILDLHNTLRNKVAGGNEPPQPSAANMKALSYNKELEFIAQCWANACNGNPLKHDGCRMTAQYSYVGQNLAWWSSTSSTGNLLDGIRNAIMNWYNEFQYFNVAYVNAFQVAGGKATGHYTQLVWANTSEVGCAVSSYTQQRNGKKWHDKILACNYGQGGNMLGSAVYIKGPPASRCSGGTPNKKYRALCGDDKPLTGTTRYTNELFNVSI